MNGSVVRTARGGARSWRMRQWPNDVTIAHLIFLDHQATPSAEAIDEAIEHARAKGARAIRTSAMFPHASPAIFDAGFEPLDELALLSIELDERRIAELSPSCHQVRPLRRWMYERAAAVDLDAFGPLWGNDAASLRDIRSATPLHHAGFVGDSRQIEGFALSGAAADCGYIQRLAVGTDWRRRGIARSLVIDALQWFHTSGRRQALVNTGVDNVGALTLYEALGFSRLGHVLTIAERRLDG